MNGGDPYAVNHSGLHFVYPPLVLAIAAWFERILPAHGLRVLFIAVHVASVLAMPFVLAYAFVRARWWGRWLPLLVLLAEPAYVGFRALYSANVAPALYLAALLAAIPGVRRNAWSLFYVVVVIAGLVKVTFLVLLLLPILAGAPPSIRTWIRTSIRTWIRSSAVVAIVAGANLLEQRLAPGLYAGYKAALVLQVKTQQLYGFGIFGFAARAEHHLHATVGIFAYSLHAVAVLLMVTILLLLKRRCGFGAAHSDVRDDNSAGSVWLGLLVIAVILANPRVLHYDMYIALIAAFAIVAIHLRLDRWKLVALAVVLHLPSFLILVGVRSYVLQTGWELTIVLAAFGLGVRELWQMSPSSQVAETVEELGASAR